MEITFSKIITYFGVYPSVLYNLAVIFILYIFSENSGQYSSCKLLNEWNISIFYILPICLIKTVFFLFISTKLEKSNEKCSVLIIFINYILSWIISVIFLIGFGELYYENHQEKSCQKLQNFDLFFIIMESLQLLFITIFGFYIFYSFVKKRINYISNPKVEEITMSEEIKDLV